MAYRDLVKQAASVNGTGPITLGAAVSGFQTMQINRLTGAIIKGYMIRSGAEWEAGRGVLGAGGTLVRTPITSSNGGALVNFTAGTGEIVETPTAASYEKWDVGTSPHVVYLSNFGVISDTNLSPYAQVAGVDQRAKIQAVLDLAKTIGPLHLVWDVKVTLANVPSSDGDTLLVSSNTTIVFLNGCGALQAAGSKGDMFKNANPTTNANNTRSAIVNENITIDGGVFHGNREGQSVKMDVFRFSGMRNLRMVNYTIYRPSGMGVRLINTDGFVNENYLIDQGVDILTASNAVSVNTDGIHVHGPAINIRDRNGRLLNCGDDPYALNADDAWGAGTFTGRFDNVYGPIIDVKVDNLYISGKFYGIRLLSGGSRIDDIRFRNISGSTGAYGLVIDNYLTPSQATLSGPGNFGNIEIDGWHMKNAYANFDWGQMSMHINAKVEQFLAKNVTKSDFNNALFPIVRIGEKANIDQLSLDISSRNYSGGTYLTEQIDVAPGAKITQADIKLRTYASSAVNGYPVRVQAGASISLLTLDGQCPNFTGMLSNQGTITTLSDRTSASAVPAPASTWVLQSAAPWSQDTNVLGKLTYGRLSGAVGSAKKTTADGLGGNVKVSGTIQVTGAVTGAMHVALIARASAMVPWSSAQNAYYLDLYLENGGGLKIGKKVAGADSTVGAALVAAFATGIAYSMSLTVKASTLTAAVQRGSDNFYLQSNGTWAATVANAITATDTSLAAASGEWGVYAFNDMDTSTTINFTNLAVVAAP